MVHPPTSTTTMPNLLTQLGGGEDIVEHHVHSTDFENKFRSYQIKHIKIPFHSPWVGSTLERLIRVVKSCLYKSTGHSKIKYFDLLTLLTDVQNAINNRLLNYRCSSDSELQVITPNCFFFASKYQ